MVKIKYLFSKYRILPVQVKASFWFVICAFLQKGISILTTPIFTRLLTTAEYGQFNVFNSWLGIISIFITLNLYAGVYTQGLIKFEEERYIFSSSLQGLTLTLSLVGTVIYVAFFSFWNQIFGLTTVQMLAMLVMIWTTAVFNFWASEQRILYKYKMLVLISLLVSLMKPVVGILFVLYAEDKVTARILGLVLVELIAYSGLFVLQIYKGKCFYTKKFWKYALGFNLPLIPHYLSQTVLNSADRIMIDKMVGAEEAGIYSLAYSVSLMMTLFNTSLSQTINPWIYQKIKEKKIKEISSVAYIALVFVAVINLILIVFAPEIVMIFAPKEYYGAIWIIPPVAMSVYFMFSYDLFAKFAFYFEKTNFVMFASVLGAVLNVVLNYIFIHLFGYRAAGYTTLFCYIIYCIGHYLFMNHTCDVFCDGIRPYDLKKILAITVSFMVGGMAILCTYNFMMLRYGLILTVGVSAIVFRRRMILYIQNFMKIRKNEI